ncbi:PREDICTED: leucine-rich repeat-containing protein 24-like [Branchiostoma belcheri]|uniref:Leucine-rich repeat-containing protein 24-like n=1 Tax=Branchiostoma belcheri TaxID=7741 RepID=A0A6P4XNE9_BRABE|nr:PREDICTED: leucine-rich repeat-containing protein 24-like [Branchiostoma belcheri]
MKPRGLLMLVTLGSLWAGCSCLPAECLTKKQNYSGTLWVDCNNLHLTTIPDDIPPNAEQFFAMFNSIKNVSYIPSLPRLEWLDLGWNAIESFSWMSLRALPVLRILSLNENRLRYVQLGSVIEHLPKLKTVNIKFNKITSVSQYELGWPQVTTARIMGNPFHCDCDLFWLIENMSCLEACKGGDEKACCRSCSACFVADVLKYKAFRLTCHSPSGLEKLSLSDVSSHLTGCWPQQLTTDVWKPTSLQLGSNPTENTKSRVGQTQTMVTTILHETARNDTKPESTQSNKGTATNPTEGSGGDFTSPNILLSAIAGTLSCFTVMILCHRLYKRKCYGYAHVH